MWIATTGPLSIGPSLVSPGAAAAGRLDRDDITCLEVERRLRRDLLPVHEVPPHRAGAASALAPRRVPAALGDDAEPGIFEEPELSHDAVAAPVSTIASGAKPQAVALDPERIRQLERFDRCVECV